jgi:hypothetical protein
MADLKLLALDAEDLEVLSAHVQDAVVRVDDMGFAQSDNRFALLINRYAWEMGTKRSKGERKRCALRFDRVLSAEPAGFDLGARDGVMQLLTIVFEPGDVPGGEIVLSFAGGGTVRLKVECLEVRLHDLGAAWSAKGRPDHALSDSI